MSARRNPDLNGFLGEGTRFEGKIHFPDRLRIEGSFKGRVEAPEASLIVAEGGEVEADVEVAELYVGGTVRGNVHASRRLEISPAGRIVGEVWSTNLIVRDGAVIEGQCHMEPSGEGEKRPKKETGADEPGPEAEEARASSPGSEKKAKTEEPGAEAAESQQANGAGAEAKSSVWRRPGWKDSGGEDDTSKRKNR